MLSESACRRVGSHMMMTKQHPLAQHVMFQSPGYAAPKISFQLGDPALG